MSVLSYASPPSFHHITLPDSSPIEDAVRLVLSARGRADSSSASASYLASRISELTGAADVGSLRRLTDGDWRAMELPAMAALYLKYAMRQSSRGTATLLLSPLAHSSPSFSSSSSSLSPVAHSFGFPASVSLPAFPSPASSSHTDPVLAELQHEFQLSQPLDLAQYTASLSVLQSMGFAQKESLEALIATDNKGEDVAVNYLFADATRRQKLKDDAKKRLSTATLASPTHPRSAATSLPSPTAVGPGVDRLLLYRELVRGLLLDERLTRKSYDGLKAEREKRKVSKAEEKQVLKELGISDDKWDKLRRQKGKPLEGQPASAAEGVDLDCVVCLDERKSHVCMPCGHVCMCGACAESVVKSRGKDGTCPMCHKKVDDCIRVFL